MALIKTIKIKILNKYNPKIRATNKITKMTKITINYQRWQTKQAYKKILNKK
jgi:hypothetical protein